MLRNWLSAYLRWRGLNGVLLYFIHRLKHFFASENQLFTVRDNYGGKVFLRSNTSDLRTFRTVVVQDEFLIPTQVQDYLTKRYVEILTEGMLPIIIDGGANIGLTACIFANQYPDAQIIAVEPNEPNYNLAKINCSPYLNIQLIQAAIWDCNEALEVIDPASDEWSYQFQPSKDNHSLNYVHGLTIDEILSKKSNAILFLLKLDIEGAEARVLRDKGQWWASTPALLVEPHDYREGQSNCIGGIMVQPSYQTGNVFICGESLIFLPGKN